jgi:aminoglycoside 6'-N-acetyltransferase I
MLGSQSLVIIREIVAADRSSWCRLRDALWPGSLTDHDVETQLYFERPHGQLVVYIAELESRIVGFLELDYRKYAPGCRSSPVPFIEGWYVEPDARGQGIGRALIKAAEGHALAAGHVEIASDAEIENREGIGAHLALGYREVERSVCFRKSLRDA